MGERKSDCRYNCGDYNPNRYLNDITSCYHCCLSTYALTRVYSQMLCCEHAMTAPMLLQFYFILFSLNSLPVLATVRVRCCGDSYFSVCVHLCIRECWRMMLGSSLSSGISHPLQL